MAFDDMRRHSACSHHQQAAGIGRRQVARSERRCGAGATVRQLRAVHRRARHAGARIEQGVGGVHSAFPAGGVLRHDRDQLHAQRCIAPRGHDKERCRIGALRPERMMLARRRFGMAPKCLIQRIDQFAARQACGKLLGIQMHHAGLSFKSHCARAKALRAHTGKTKMA